MNPQPSLIDNLIDILIKEGGSDLHVSAGRLPSIRVATQLIPLVNQTPLSPEDMQNSLTAILGPEKYAKFLANQEIDFSYEQTI